MPFSEPVTSVDTHKFVFVQSIDTEELADGWPWYLQEKVDAKLDVTIAYIGGRCFGMQLDRASFDGIDWRKHIGTGTDKLWEYISLPDWLQAKIHAYMKEMRLDYGRLDFLASKKDFSDIVFLEVNPHGQWGWMDLNKDKGIYAAMMEFLTTPRPKSAKQ